MTTPFAAARQGEHQFYLLAKTFKDRLVSVVQSEQEFGPDLSHGEPGSQEWLDWWELS